jgi:hypothetical protein
VLDDVFRVAGYLEVRSGIHVGTRQHVVAAGADRLAAQMRVPSLIRKFAQ